MLFIQPVYKRYTYNLCVKPWPAGRDSIELDRIMRLIHNSRLPQFRTPFGAVTTGTTLSLSVILEDADPNQATLTLRTWVDEIGESLYPMTHEGDGIFTVELECTEPCLIWYSFICNIEGQPEVRLGAPQGRTGGEGVTYATPRFRPSRLPSISTAKCVPSGTSVAWSTRSSPIATPVTKTGASARWPRSKNRATESSAVWSRTGTSRPCTSAPKTAPSRPGTSTALAQGHPGRPAPHRRVGIYSYLPQPHF